MIAFIWAMHVIFISIHGLKEHDVLIRSLDGDGTVRGICRIGKALMGTMVGPF